MKRGQVAIFIIVAIVFVFSIVIALVFNDKMIDSDDPELSDEVFVAVQSCLDESSDLAFRYVLLQGGNYDYDDSDGLQIYSLANPVSRGGGMTKSEYEFSKEGIASGTKILLEGVFGLCINEIDFSDFDGEVSFGEYEIEVDVFDGKVMTNLYLPTTIKKLDKSIYRKEFSYEEAVNVKMMEDVVEEIVRSSVVANEAPYGLIENYDERDIMDVDFFFVEEDFYFNNMVYTVTFLEGDYTVGFVVKYDWFGEGVV